MNWVSAQMHSHVAFNVYELSGTSRVARVEHVHKVNKVGKKLHERTISLKYFPLGNITKLVIECFNDAVFDDLERGG